MSARRDDSPTIARQVVEAIRLAGIDTLFCLPGVQNDDFFDALVDASDIRPIVTRHEQGAAYMANGASLVAGKPAAFCVVPGPGMLNAGGRAHERLLVERPRARDRRRDRHGGPRARLRRAARAPRPARHPRPAHQARRAARRRRVRDQADPGGARRARVGPPATGQPRGARRPVARAGARARSTRPSPEQPAIDQRAIERAADALRRAERPLIVVGGGAQDAGEAIGRLAELLQAPVTDPPHGPRRDPDHAPDVRPSRRRPRAVEDRRRGRRHRHRGSSGRSCTGAPTTTMTIVKIDIDADELDRHGAGTIGVCGDADDAVRRAAGGARRHARPGPTAPTRSPGCAPTTSPRSTTSGRSSTSWPRSATCCPTTGSSSRT